jgi:hypothetical protein
LAVAYQSFAEENYVDFRLAEQGFLICRRIVWEIRLGLALGRKQSRDVRDWTPIIFPSHHVKSWMIVCLPPYESLSLGKSSA